MPFLRRRRSRRERVRRHVRDLRERLPEPPDLPDFPDVPSLREIRVPGRSKRSASQDSPLLSLAGGLLLGLLVGIVVAFVLIARGENEDASSQRQTGITLLPEQSEESRASSTASTGI